MTFKITPGNGLKIGSGVTLQPVRRPLDGFPVDNPEIQWYISAENLNTGTITSGNLITPNLQYPNYTIPSSGQTWIASTNLNVNSYTSLYGKTVKYIQLAGSNLRTFSDCYDYDSILANGGYTIWSVVRYNITIINGWTRLLWYINTGDTAFGHIISFLNSNSGTLEYRIGHANAATNSDWIQSSNPGISSNGNDLISFQFFSLVGNPNVLTGGDGIVEYNLYRRMFSRTTEALQATQSTLLASETANPVFSLNNATNVRPYIDDNTYNIYGAPWPLMEMGFANRPYTLSEITNNLYPWVFNKYMGT